MNNEASVHAYNRELKVRLSITFGSRGEKEVHILWGSSSVGRALHSTFAENRTISVAGSLLVQVASQEVVGSNPTSPCSFSR